MNDSGLADLKELSFEQLAHVDSQCDRFEAEWIAGNQPRLEDFLPPESDAVFRHALTELLHCQRDLATQSNVVVDVSALQTKFPEHETLIAKLSSHLDETNVFPSTNDVEVKSPWSAHLQEETAAFTSRDPDQVRAVADQRYPAVPGYQIEAELGRGGNGIVYRAVDMRLKRPVALKMLRSGLDAGSDQLVRFRTEAEAAARLQHANIVQIYDVGEHDGLPFLTLEYVPGSDLKAYATQNSITPRVAATALRSIARAIGFAHGNGVIHRDLKPENILVPAGSRTDRGQLSSTLPTATESGVGRVSSDADTEVTFVTAQQTLHDEHTQPADPTTILAQAKIADFGLAKQLDRDQGYTQTGNVLGTASYMSPEQASGRTDIGPATDVYSLGAILYFLLTGHVPFRGSTLIQTLKMVVENEPVPPRRHRPELDADIDTICLKCLEKQPERRYASADDLADDLNRYLHGQPIHARPLSNTEHTVRWARRNPALAALITVGLFLAVAGPAMALYQLQLSRSLQLAITERDTADEQQLEARAQMLLTTRLTNFAEQLQSLSAEREQVNQWLWNQWQEDRLATSQSRLRVALALIGMESAAQRYVRVQLHELPDMEFIVAAQLIVQHCAADPARTSDWVTFLQHRESLPQLDSEQRHRSMLLRHHLFSDSNPADDPNTGDNFADLAAWLCRKQEPALSSFIDFATGSAGAMDAAIQQIFHESPEAESRRGAATALARYYHAAPETLVQLILEADADQFRILDAVCRRRFSDSLTIFRGALDAAPKLQNPDKSLINRRRANAGICLTLAGYSDEVWPHLRHSNDPELRTNLIHSYSALGVPARLLIKTLFNSAFSKDVSVQRALVLALGEYSPDQFGAQQLDDLVDQLTTIDPVDSGLYAAIAWTLRQLGREDSIPSLPLAAQNDGSASTFRTPRGLEMAVVKAHKRFRAGSPPYERSRVSTNEKFMSLRIDRTFAISTTEVTHQLFEEFLRDHPEQRKIGPESFEIKDKYPQSRITWFQAMAFCHWLNVKEDISESEWCFFPNSDGEFDAGLTFAWNALDRRGYRLPTQAEWEYACRAGAETSRYYGDDIDLLDRFAWHAGCSEGRTHDVASLKPNDFGLFDMLGNISEFTLDPTASLLSSRSQFTEQKLFGPSDVNSNSKFNYRGANQYSGPLTVRNAVHFKASPGTQVYQAGMRVVRTLHHPTDLDVIEQRVASDPENLQLVGRYLTLLCRDGRADEATNKYESLLDVTQTDDGGIVFTGNGEFLEFAHIPFDSGESYTIEAWVRDWHGVLCNQGQFRDPENSVWINLPLHIGWESGSGMDHYTLPERLELDTGWSHLALVIDGTTRRIFTNGQLLVADRRRKPGPLVDSRPFQIGALMGKFDVGRGILGALRVSNSARYTGPFRPDRSLTEDDSTVLFVDRSRVKGRTIVDRSDQQIGRFVNAPWIRNDASQPASAQPGRNP